MIAELINNRIDEVLDTFRANMQTRGNAAWRKVARNIRAMEVDTQGKLVNSEFNQDTQQDIAFELLSTIQAPQFDAALTRMKSSLEGIQDDTRDHYEEKFGPIPYEIERLATGLVTSTKNEIDNEIGHAGFEAEVVNPAISAMNGHLINRSTRDAMLNDMEHRIKDRLRTFTDIKASTLMQQFGRRINDLYGSFGAARAKYAGPSDGTELTPDAPRDFCRAKIGKTYTREEIMQWPIEQAPWNGMIPGTDRGSIFVNLGGYNCRHFLEWE